MGVESICCRGVRMNRRLSEGESEPGIVRVSSRS